MRRLAWLTVLALAACQTGDPHRSDSTATTSRAVSTASPVAPPAQPTERPAPDSPEARTAGGPPGVALITTRPGARESRVWFQYPDREPTLVGRVDHLPDAEARGAVLGSAVWVVADVEGSGEDSFGAGLFRVQAHSAPRLLATRCVHASRPWVTASGQVLVQRGQAGELPTLEAIRNGALRTDALSLDGVDPESGKIRTLHRFDGYITHLAAVTATEAVLYRVSYHHADLVAVDLETARLRVIAPEIPAFARDFSLDGSTQTLLFTNRDDSGWVVERVALSGNNRELAARVEGPWAKPAAWPRGGVLLNDSRGGEVRGGPGPSRAFGSGFDSVRAVSPKGLWAALVHEKPDEFPIPYWVDVSSSSVQPIPTPSGARVDIAGWAP